MHSFGGVELVLLGGGQVREPIKRTRGPHWFGASWSETGARESRAGRCGNRCADHTAGTQLPQQLEFAVVQDVDGGSGKQIHGLEAIEIQLCSGSGHGAPETGEKVQEQTRRVPRGGRVGLVCGLR